MNLRKTNQRKTSITKKLINNADEVSRKQRQISALSSKKIINNALKNKKLYQLKPCKIVLVDLKHLINLSNPFKTKQFTQASLLKLKSLEQDFKQKQQQQQQKSNNQEELIKKSSSIEFRK